MVLLEKDGLSAALEQLSELRLRLRLGAAPTLPDQLALSRLVSLLPSDTTTLENAADRASPSLALEDTFILMVTTPPLEHISGDEIISPFDERFSAFVFKIQANMNKAHRDRIAFLRICSGQFERGREYWHVQADRPVKLSQPQQMMAQEREIVDTAYAGDIIGVFDPGIFSIGDTVCEKGEKLRYAGIPTFAPEHFAVVEQIDSMKRKQFAKGVTEIAQEGAIQIFFEPGTGMERVVVGVVGVLQFDVLQFRMESEYGVRYNKRDLPHQLIRYIDNADLNPAELKLMQTTRWVQDVRGRNLLIFVGQYEIDWALDKNPGLTLSEFNQNTDAV